MPPWTALLWIVAIVALLVGLYAAAHARRLSRRLETLNQAYWELRYDYTRLRSQVARLDPEQAEPAPPAAAAAEPSQSFVPLTSLLSGKSGRKKTDPS